MHTRKNEFTGCLTEFTVRNRRLAYDKACQWDSPNMDLAWRRNKREKIRLLLNFDVEAQLVAVVGVGAVAELRQDYCAPTLWIVDVESDTVAPFGRPQMKGRYRRCRNRLR